MTTFQIILFIFLISCAIAVSFTRNLLNAVLVYMSFSLIMSIVWVLLESPDLAITEAAVGAGITSALLFITLKKVKAIDTAEKYDNVLQINDSDYEDGGVTHE